MCGVTSYENDANLLTENAQIPLPQLSQNTLRSDCLYSQNKSKTSHSPVTYTCTYQIHANYHGFDLKGVLEADEDVYSLAEHPAVGGQGQVGHHSVQHSAPGGSHGDLTGKAELLFHFQ